MLAARALGVGHPVVHPEPAPISQISPFGEVGSMNT